jgi:hypothetical protein
MEKPKIITNEEIWDAVKNYDINHYESITIQDGRQISQKTIDRCHEYYINKFISWGEEKCPHFHAPPNHHNTYYRRCCPECWENFKII